MLSKYSALPPAVFSAAALLEAWRLPPRRVGDASAVHLPAAVGLPDTDSYIVHQQSAPTAWAFQRPSPCFPASQLCLGQCIVHPSKVIYVCF